MARLPWEARQAHNYVHMDPRITSCNCPPFVPQEAHEGVKFLSFDTTEEQLDGLSSELGVKALPAFKFYKVPVGAQGGARWCWSRACRHV